MTRLAESSTEYQLDLPELNGLFEATDPQKIVSWAAARFGAEMAMTSSFGAESAMLIHMATQVLPNIRIVMVDTGYLFPETWRHMEDLRSRFNLNVWVYHTQNDPIAYLHKAGETNPEFREDRDACCAANKIEPMNRAMRELSPKAWLRGIRRNQTNARNDAKFVDWAARYNCHAVSPLLNWGSREIFAYMKKYGLPFHPLYEKGYASIGCNPLSCTRPISAGEDPRSGRWAGSAKVECGINLTNSLDSSHL